MAIYEVGAEVFWNDPDAAECSRFAVVAAIVTDLPDGEAVYRLDDGTEVFEHELDGGN